MDRRIVIAVIVIILLGIGYYSGFFGLRQASIDPQNTTTPAGARPPAPVDSGGSGATQPGK